MIAKVLKELVSHHIKEEEASVWADARKNFSNDQSVEENAPSTLPPEDASDSPKNPIKPSEAPAETQPEMPKIGTPDAPGG